KCGRLSHIMQEHAEGKDRRRIPHHSQHHPRMDEYISFWMVLGGLFHPAHGLDLRQYLQEQAAFVEKVQPPLWFSACQNLQQLVANSFPTYHVNVGRQVSNSLPRLCRNLEIEVAGEANRSQHSQFVLDKSFLRFADGSDDSTT